jgi:4-hydroxyphenylpyruvate dioxygenase
MTSQKDNLASSKRDDALSLRGFDYIELYVGNAHQAAYYYHKAFGFHPVAYAGLETGERDRVSFVMEQGRIRLTLTAANSPDSQVAEQVRLQGDCVRDIAFAVDDAARAFEIAVKRGAIPVMEPAVFEDPGGRLVKSTVAACGRTVHSFIQRDPSLQAFLPRYRSIGNAPPALPVGLEEIDHVAISVEKGALDRWIDFYQDVLGFHQSHTEDISTEYSAMNSRVVQNGDGSVKFPIMEPAQGRRKSQIEEYLQFNHGPGAQHVAFLSDNIVETVRALRKNGVEFLLSPDTYYQMLEKRVGEINEDIDLLRKLNILADCDQWGYLLQIFSKPLQSRPTFFVEVIQRAGARGFGGGNIRALFEAVEREQAMRGNL